MYPELFTIPVFDHPIKSYGAMLTLGFLTGVWLSMRRAERMKADPDIILNIGFICLLCGVAGARLFYVLHYWESSFANQSNPFFAALNCTSGGLEYYGGLIGAIVGTIVYVAVKRVSLRMYVDILAPAAAWGLAFGRMGCLLNGCCWGGICVDAHGHQTVPWGIRFPHHSPAQMRQWENRQLTLPAELIVSHPDRLWPSVLPHEALNMPAEMRDARLAEARAAEKAYVALRQDEAADPGAIEAAKARLERAMQQVSKRGLGQLAYALKWPSRDSDEPGATMTVADLTALAGKYRSQYVHPAQVYGIINALLLSWLLLEVLYRRKRHGVVFALLCTIYPITRMILEVVRVDNPHDSAGLTISQAVSVGMFLFGLGMLLYLRRLPEQSPLAVPYEPPTEEPPAPIRSKKQRR